MSLAALALVVAALPPRVAAEERCRPRVLVLGAMPLEIHPFLEAGTFDEADTVRVEDHTFYVGELAGHDVVLAMTGIGLVNARQTIETAFEHVGCGYYGVVFSGVAGSKRRIGDVTIPRRWTLDGGATWTPVDGGMFAVARTLAGTDDVDLRRTVPVGDDACLCPGVETLSTPVTLEHQPAVFVGGAGTSSDTYGDRALPCVPRGGDVFGCQPCLAPGATAAETAEFATEAPSYADPEFLRGFFTPPAGTTDTYEAQDMETTAVAEVAAREGVPFLGIRSASDGEGDPLNLPGFPFQFFAYRHLAGENAAATTIAFLERWPAQAEATPSDAARASPPRDRAGERAGAPLPATGSAATTVFAGAVLLVAASTLRAVGRARRDNVMSVQQRLSRRGGRRGR